MNRRRFVALVVGMAAGPLAARAQQQRLSKIGFLSSGSPTAFEKLNAAFHQGLSDEGFVEGRNVLTEYRWAQGNYGDLERLAFELVQVGVDLIAASGGIVSARAAARATSTIPIVFIAGFDPVRVGLVVSENRPAGNITGVSVYTTELSTKRLELLVELVPETRNIAILVNPGSVTTSLEIEDTLKASKRIGRVLQVIKASSEAEIDAGFARATQEGIGALLVSADSFFTARRRQITALAGRLAIPTIYPWREYVEAGGLVSYGPELTWAYHQIGSYAGQILKGTRPRDLPVVFPTKFFFVLNLKTAEALGLNVSPTLLALADETIE
jgi:putative ABC transport system substrate-binding protein